jgi:hypothetical protein
MRRRILVSYEKEDIHGTDIHGMSSRIEADFAAKVACHRAVYPPMDTHRRTDIHTKTHHSLSFSPASSCSLVRALSLFLCLLSLSPS